MKRRLVVFASVAALLAGAYLAYVQWFSTPPFPTGLLLANGRIEGDYVTVASKFAGRIAERHVREGDSVSGGQILVKLEDGSTRAKVDQAAEAVNVCEATIQAARANVESIDAQIKAAETLLDVLRKEVPLTIAAAEADLSHAKAALASADSTEGNLRRDLERSQKLRESNAISQEALEDSRLAWTKARNDLTTANAAVTKADKQLATERLGPDRVASEVDQLDALRAQKSAAIAVVAECMATKAQAEAALKEAKFVLADLTILAPSLGMIMTRFADHGEVVRPGTPLFEIVDLDQLYLKVYVPEIHVGKVRLGCKARIYGDAFPDRHFDATVRYVSSRAEFTPKEVQTPDERVKLVYAVKLYLDENPDHCLTPGLPADAVIRWQDDAEWAKPQW